MSPATADLDDLIVSPDAPILEVMRVIDRSGLEVALVCDRQRKLLAVVTDGDIRRWLIKGGSLTDSIAGVGNPKFTAVPPGTPRQEALRIMVERSYKSIPVVDDRGRLDDLHTLHTALLGHRTESWAVVMAGGKGERLGDLTKMIPKPMLPIGDRPILERIVQHLVSHGIRRIFLSVNYLGTMIEDHFGDGSRFFCKIEYLREDQPLGTGGPIALLPSKPTAPLVVMNGDLLTSINIARLMAFHRAGEFTATVALREHVVKVPFGVAELDGPRVRKLVEKPTLNYRINAGIYVLSPDAVARVPKGRMFPITELLEGCLQRGEGVGAYHMQEDWNDIGLPEEYARAHQV
ncbi:alcohol dehydrogenase [Planctomycetota bacterium]|nr:alcohol dehydrogenase [Planctomycetota bacterium]